MTGVPWFAPAAAGALAEEFSTALTLPADNQESVPINPARPSVAMNVVFIICSTVNLGNPASGTDVSGFVREPKLCPDPAHLSIAAAGPF